MNPELSIILWTYKSKNIIIVVGGMNVENSNLVDGERYDITSFTRIVIPYK